MFLNEEILRRKTHYIEDILSKNGEEAEAPAEEFISLEMNDDFLDMPYLSQQPACPTPQLPSPLTSVQAPLPPSGIPLPFQASQILQEGGGRRSPQKRRRAPYHRGTKRRRLPIKIVQSQSPSTSQRDNDGTPATPDQVETRPSTSTTKFFDNFMVIEEGASTSKKFKCSRYTGTYMLRNLESVYPERELYAIFQRSLDVVMQEATTRNEDVDWICISISSPGMDMPIFQNLHKISGETIATLVRKFEAIDQSQRNKGKSPLIEERINVDLSVVSRGALREDRKQKIYAGRGRVKFQQPVSNIMYKGINLDSLILVQNDDNYCLLRSINLVIAKATLTNLQFHRYCKDEKTQAADIQRMIDWMELPEQESYCINQIGDHIQDYLDDNFSDHGFKIFAFTNDAICDEEGIESYFHPLWISSVLNFKTPLPIYYSRDGETGHYDGIRCINSFFFCRNYCFTCLKSYDRDDSHNCESRCDRCCSIIYDITPCAPDPGFKRHCDDCNKDFFNVDCWERHAQNGACQSSKQCDKCGKLYYVGSDRPEHKCGSTFCRRCDTYHPFRRGCFIKQLKPDPEPLDYRIIIYDCETTQEERVSETKSKHFANLIGATILCTKCIRENTWRDKLDEDNLCGICGSYRTITWSVHDFEQTDVDRKVKTPNPMRRFMKWVLTEFKHGDAENVVIAHNGGRFDHVLLFHEIFRITGIQPEILLQGNKFFEISIKQDGVTPTYFRDSVNWMRLKLSQMISSFGIQGIADKPFFPYLANKSENLGVVMESLPPKEDYCYSSMLPKTKEEFDVWYEANCCRPFDLAEELASYCLNDVNILAHGVVELKKLFEETAGVDILKCNTIASACMRAFRMMLPSDEHLALVTEKGVGMDKAFKQSDIARKYLRWYEKVNNVVIQDCEHRDYEKKIGKYRVDGFVNKEQRPEGQQEKDLVIEIHGCFYHACEKCHPNDREQLLGNRTAGKIRERNRKREEELRQLGEEQGFELQIKWECEIRDEMKRNPEMKKFFENCLSAGAIKLRESLSGGRTEVFKMHLEADDEHEIKYLDVQSLYPYQLYSQKFPISHPKCKILNKDVEWSRLSDMEEYEQRTNDLYLNGLIKCLILPPRNLRFPPIQAKFEDSNLLFPLCRSCANERNPEGLYLDNSYNCEHHDWRERAWVATLTRPELRLALRNRYVVKKIFRSYWFEKWDSELFRNYIKKFLKIKIQASGWPSSCKDPRFPDELPDVFDPDLTPEDVDIIFKLRAERAAYISETNLEVDVDIKPEKVKWNDGLRYIAKLALNNLWGRFALRNRLSQSKVVTDPGVFLDYLDDKKIEINGFCHLNEESLLLTFTVKENYMEENRCSNLPIAIFTTAYARVHLYGIIEKLERAGAEIAYVDTDSVIFKYKKSKGMPIEIGQTLGTLTDEYPNDTILEFVASGCKSYALKLRNNITGKIKHVMKCKGITLDYDARQQLPYERFRDNVLKFHNADNYEKIYFEFNKIRNTKQGDVYTVETGKYWAPLVTKGNVTLDSTILPYGYTNFEDDSHKISYYEYCQTLPYYNFELHPAEHTIAEEEYHQLVHRPSGDPFDSESSEEDEEEVEEKEEWYDE